MSWILSLILSWIVIITMIALITFFGVMCWALCKSAGDYDRYMEEELRKLEKEKILKE